MADAEPRASQVNIDSVRISGVPADVNAAGLRKALREGVARTLGAPERPQAAEHSADIRRLKVRVGVMGYEDSGLEISFKRRCSNYGLNVGEYARQRIYQRDRTK